MLSSQTGKSALQSANNQHCCQSWRISSPLQHNQYIYPSLVKRTGLWWLPHLICEDLRKAARFHCFGAKTIREAHPVCAEFTACTTNILCIFSFLEFLAFGTVWYRTKLIGLAPSENNSTLWLNLLSCLIWPSHIFWNCLSMLISLVRWAAYSVRTLILPVQSMPFFASLGVWLLEGAVLRQSVPWLLCDDTLCKLFQAIHVNHTTTWWTQYHVLRHMHCNVG